MQAVNIKKRASNCNILYTDYAFVWFLLLSLLPLMILNKGDYDDQNCNFMEVVKVSMSHRKCEKDNLPFYFIPTDLKDSSISVFHPFS